MPCEVERFKPRPCVREDEFSERAAKLCQECWYNSINAQRRCGEVISNYKAKEGFTHLGKFIEYGSCEEERYWQIRQDAQEYEAEQR